jgi:hypothetical protein
MSVKRLNRKQSSFDGLNKQQASYTSLLAPVLITLICHFEPSISSGGASFREQFLARAFLF